jgi:TonB family protein
LSAIKLKPVDAGEPMRNRLIPIAFIGLAVSSAAAASRVPKLLNMGEVFTAEDYPKVAQINNQEGSVEVLLDVDRTGIVTSCKIKRSSGHASLDEQTWRCFVPAHASNRAATAAAARSTLNMSA